MHALFEQSDRLTRDVIGAAIEVHRLMGPGLIEGIYEKCLARELELRGHRSARQHAIRIKYKDLMFDEVLRCDLLVDDCLLLELKVAECVLPVHKAQLLSYMKLLNIPVGLLINFHSEKLTDGICRLILKGADR